MRALAQERPDILAIGIDADPTRMREVSRRCREALFVVAAAESPPAELAGRASLVTITMPWGSLLRGVVGEDQQVLNGIAELLASGASMRAIVSITARDAGAEGAILRDPAELARRYDAAGLSLVVLRAATAAEVAASRSSWAKRTGAGLTRPASLIEAVRN